MAVIYIAGKIGNLPMVEVEATFQKAKEYLSHLGYKVVTPLDLPHNHDKSWSSYMIEDLQALIKADEVAMLPNWTDSPGAKIEHAFAQRMGKHILYLPLNASPER